jgi:hypothetical protein
MKQIIFILCLYSSFLFSNLCAYAQAKSPSPPYPIFQQSTRGVSGEKSELDFQVNAPSSGNYHLFFHVVGLIMLMCLFVWMKRLKYPYVYMIWEEIYTPMS